MATFTTRKLIVEMLEHDGRYMDDPPPVAIYQYYNPSVTQMHWMVGYSKLDIISMNRSSNVQEVRLLWSQQDGLTNFGKLFLEGKL